MDKPSIENLRAQMQGFNLNVHQKADALIEFNKLLEYVDYLQTYQVKAAEQYSVDEVNILLKHQIEDVRQFVDRCARDKGAVRADFDGWIKEAPVITLHTTQQERPKEE